jgi:multidrug efflux system membrane fusion protein
LQAAMRSGGKAMKAAITLPGGKAEALESEVRFLDNSVDATTGTIQLKAIVANQDEGLAPGQFVNVSLVLETLKEATVVPAEAVQQGSEGPFLFVVKEDGTAEIRKIQVTSVQRGVAIVAKGLAAGETVVTEGQLRLTPGARVRPAGADKKPG